MTSSDTRSAAPASKRAAFRPDIEGMRAVAVGLVLVYHAGVTELSGGFIGVDVFFVISGFLITGLLLREIERTGRISLPTFYARRAKRLLPATGVVLVATTVLTWLTTSVVEWRTFGADIFSAALYFVNWRLAGRSVDYLAEEVGTSPVQHFWSLAIEEQFYIVWPLLLVALAWWWRRHQHIALRPLLAGGILAVIVPSFGYSLLLTATDPARAFFVTPTRLWEMGIGALLAIGATLWLRVPRRVAVVMGWAGLVTVVLSAWLIDAATMWPGYAALAPTLGTAAMIVSGYSAGRTGPGILLGTRPAVWVGGLSYSLYLWHWPILVAATAYWGELGAKRGLLVVAASFLPAYLGNRLVENPIRFAPSLTASNPLTLSLGANFTVLGAVAGLLLALAVPSGPAPADQDAPGAAVLPTGSSADAGEPGTVGSLTGVDWFVPNATQAVDDVPDIYARGCQVDQISPDPVLCKWGAEDGDITVAVVGDSKMMQWHSAIDAIAREEGWRAVSYSKSACGFSDGMQVNDGEPYESCAAWNETVLEEILELQPDVLLTSQRIGTALTDVADPDSGSTEVMVDGLERRWLELTEHGIPVIALLDNPNPGMPVYECVAEHPDDLTACTFDRQAGVERSGAPAQEGAAARAPQVQSLDLRASICPASRCVPVIGNVLVYRQTSHLTDTYVRTLTDDLTRSLVPAVRAAL